MATPDLVHDPEEYQRPLHPLRFLLGHFYGEGHYAQGSNSFCKEMSGSWEAGGRFIGLRMKVTYPLSDGRRDIHEAFVIIGALPSAGQFVAQAYTDSGAILTYQLEWNTETLSFADQPPTAHGKRAQRARKSLVPIADGFEERLEVDWGNGSFEPYSIAVMHHVQ